MTIIIILLIFAATIYLHVTKGSGYSLIKLLGLIGSYLMAWLFYQPMSKFLSLWVPYPGLRLDVSFTYYPDSMMTQLDTVYYQAVAFIFIFLIGQLIVALINHLVGNQRDLRYPRPIDYLFGVISGVTQAWFIVFLAFAFMTLLTFPIIQNYLANNVVADFFIRNSMIFSRHTLGLWLNGVAAI